MSQICVNVAECIARENYSLNVRNQMSLLLFTNISLHFTLVLFLKYLHTYKTKTGFFRASHFADTVVSG